MRDLPKAIAMLIVEFGVFPWQTFRDSESVRRASIGFTAIFAVALPAVALVNGNVAIGLGLLAILGGTLAVMVAADRRIARRREAERARRAAARAPLDTGHP